MNLTIPGPSGDITLTIDPAMASPAMRMAARDHIANRRTNMLGNVIAKIIVSWSVTGWGDKPVPILPDTVASLGLATLIALVEAIEVASPSSPPLGPVPAW